jgi:hypothetical protein
MAHQTGQSHHELIAKQNADRRYERFTPMQVHDPLYETKKDASTQAEIKAAIQDEQIQTDKNMECIYPSKYSIGCTKTLG